MASPVTEKPVVKVETQMANTISDNVSDMTVAPIVTITGSSRVAPSRATMARASNVWDASSDPITMAGMTANPKMMLNAVPRTSGKAVGKKTNTVEGDGPGGRGEMSI